MTELKQDPKIQKTTPIYCPDCNNKIPQEVIENNNDPNVICCPLCGYLIPFEPNIDPPQTIQGENEQKIPIENSRSLTKRNLKWYLKLHFYFSIHNLLSSKVKILSKVKQQKNLNSLTIKRYAKQLRSILLKRSISRNLISILNPRDQKKLKKVFQMFKETLKDEKQFNEHNIQAFIEGIEFIFSVMKGDYEFVDLSHTEKELIMELKKKVNMFKDIRNKRSPERRIINIFALIIHQRLFTLIRTNKHFTSDAVKELVDGLIDQLRDQDSSEWIKTQINIELTRTDSQNFNIIRTNLNSDWVQRESLSDILVSCVEAVHVLIQDTTGEINLSTNKLTKIIYQGLEESKLFERDRAFKTREKLNITIVLARMINALIFVALPPPREPKPNQKIPTALQREIKENILEGLVDHLEINPKFLLRFYNFSLDKFHNTLEILLEKVEGDKIYRASFRTFLMNLINTVFKVTRQEPKESKLSPLELRIREDLELYPYDWRITNLKLFGNTFQKKNEFPNNNTEFEDLKNICIETGKKNLDSNPDMKNSSLTLTKLEEITKDLILNYIQNNSEDYSLLCNVDETISHYNLWFFDQIRDCLESIPNVHLNKVFKKYWSFSSGMNKLFGLCDNYIGKNRQKSFAKKIIAEDILERMKISLKSIIFELTEEFPQYQNDLEEIEQKICDIFQNYSKRLRPNSSYKYRMDVKNPYFKPNYFLKIDTLKKAYFLGLMFADGWIGEDIRRKTMYYYMGLKFKSEDTLLLLHLCEALGLNPDKIRIYVDLNKKTDSRTMISTVSWGGQKMAKDLISLGMSYIYDLDKSERRKNPVLPQLRSKNLMLAFLLGYFDGDGTIYFKRASLTGVGSPKIYSSSERFLEQIKSYFKIKTDPYPTTTKNVYELALPTSLYAEMLKNYSLSLKRKRISLEWTKKESRKEQFFWFKKVFTEDKIRHIYSYVSPSSISKLVNISQISLLRYAKEEYNLKPKSSNHYREITWDIKKNGEKSPYFEVVKKIRDFLQKNAFDLELSYKPSPIPKVGIPSFKLYTPRLEFYQWYI